MLKLLRLLSAGQSVVLPTDDYRTTMRTIGSYQSRGSLPDTLIYKKALIIIGEEMHLGVEVTNNETV